MAECSEALGNIVKALWMLWAFRILCGIAVRTAQTGDLKSKYCIKSIHRTYYEHIGALSENSSGV